MSKILKNVSRFQQTSQLSVHFLSKFLVILCKCNECKIFCILSGVIFPEQFYTFLKNYMSKFAMLPVLTADEKISRY